jgi:predicted anti-sigma-YlaC factor YlaD
MKTIMAVTGSPLEAVQILEGLRGRRLAGIEISILLPERLWAGIGPEPDGSSPVAASSPGGAAAAILAEAVAWLGDVSVLMVADAGRVGVAGPLATILGRLHGEGAPRLEQTLATLAVPEEEALRFAEKVTEANILFYVQAEGPTDRKIVREVFAAAGAQDIVCVPDEAERAILAVAPPAYRILSEAN